MHQAESIHCLASIVFEEGFIVGKRSKSKRFVAQGKVSVAKHDEVFTYRSTLADVEQ